MSTLCKSKFVFMSGRFANVEGVGTINVAKRAARPRHAFHVSPPRRQFNGPARCGNYSGCFSRWVQASTWLWAGLGGVGFFFFRHGGSLPAVAGLVFYNKTEIW